MSWFKKFAHTLSHAAHAVIHSAGKAAGSIEHALNDAVKVVAVPVMHTAGDVVSQAVNIQKDVIVGFHKAMLAPVVRMANDTVHGNWKQLGRDAGDFGHEVGSVVAYVPGVGTPLATALNTAISIIEGDGPIATALEPLLNTPPFADLPLQVKDILRAIVKGLVDLASGRKADQAMSDLALAQLRKTVVEEAKSTGIPGAEQAVGMFFDAAISLVIRRKPLKAVGSEMLNQAAATAQNQAFNALNTKINVLRDMAPAPLKQGIQDLNKLPDDFNARIEKLKAMAPGPLKAELDKLQKEADAKLKTIAPIKAAQKQAQAFADLAHSAYLNTIPSRVLVQKNPSGKFILKGFHAHGPLIPALPTKTRPSLKQIQAPHAKAVVLPKGEVKKALQPAKHYYPVIPGIASIIGAVVAGPIGFAAGAALGGAADFGYRKWKVKHAVIKHV